MNSAYSRPISWQGGFTLIELMIALALGAVLMGGIIQIFLSTKQSYRVNEALSRMQENGRFAMDFIARDIRQADFRDCALDRPQALSNITGMSAAIGGTDNTGLNGSDVLSTNSEVAQSTSRCSTSPLSDPPCATAPVYPSSCSTVPGNAPREYSIANSGGQPSLMQNGIQLIEGVENLQVLYGINTDSDVVDPSKSPNYYTTAPAVGSADWDKVTSIRVSLLLRTIEDNVTNKQQPYTFNTVTTDPAPDRRIRRVITSTFAVRNRLPT